MRFAYRYETNGHVLRGGFVTAPDRDEALERLAERGVCPCELERVPELHERILAKLLRGRKPLLATAGVVTAAILVYLGMRSMTDDRCIVRRQLVGDATLIEEGVRDGWREVIEGDGNRYLVQFIQPGIPAGEPEPPEAAIADLVRSTAPVAFADGESELHHQVRGMLNFIKRELAEYLADGGNVHGYIRRLRERQEKECSYHLKSVQAVERALLDPSVDQIDDFWRRTNEDLRAMGLPLVPIPEILQ